MLLYLHLINFKIFFHPAKFDNFKDETISDYKTVSVSQSQILAGLKTLGLVGLHYEIRNLNHLPFGMIMSLDIGLLHPSRLLRMKYLKKK